MKKLLDLRFVIGIFFSLIGVLLIFYHFFGKQNSSFDNKVNLWSGIVFLVFGLSMIFISEKNKLDETDQGDLSL